MNIDIEQDQRQTGRTIEMLGKAFRCATRSDRVLIVMQNPAAIDMAREHLFRMVRAHSANAEKQGRVMGHIVFLHASEPYHAAGMKVDRVFIDHFVYERLVSDFCSQFARLSRKPIGVED